MMNPSYLVAAVLLAACSIPDVTFTGPNCAGLEKTCGANRDGSCCTSRVVQGGTYYRSYDLAGDPSTSGDMRAPATVSTFQLDKYEVTVGRFRAFVNAGMGTQTIPPQQGAGAHANIERSGWDPSWNMSLTTDTAVLKTRVRCNSSLQTWTDSPGENENRPMNCLTWYEAMAFCVWDSGYLPTEAEWNYAAAGGDQQRAYPWSSPAGSLTLDSSYAIYKDGMNCGGKGGPDCTVADLAPVGSRPNGDGLWRQSDLAGNVWEWTLDWAASYATVTPCVDCADLTAGSVRVIRGGSFFRDATQMRTGTRLSASPTDRFGDVGVRCARAP